MATTWEHVHFKYVYNKNLKNSNRVSRVKIIFKTHTQKKLIIW